MRQTPTTPRASTSLVHRRSAHHLSQPAGVCVRVFQALPSRTRCATTQRRCWVDGTRCLAARARATTGTATARRSATSWPCWRAPRARGEKAAAAAAATPAVVRWCLLVTITGASAGLAACGFDCMRADASRGSASARGGPVVCPPGRILFATAKWEQGCVVGGMHGMEG